MAYEVTYSSNTNAGTASVTVSDKADGDYEVNGSKTFTISPKTIGDGDTAAEGITVEMTEDGSLSAVKDGSTTLYGKLHRRCQGYLCKSQI